ncbi:MAG: hypothetical protein AAF495_12240 [Pseudomonadota bacterium]
MEQRFIVLNNGMNLDIFKFPASQTARIETELALQGSAFQIYTRLDDAKAAIIGEMERNGEWEPRSTGSFSTSGKDMASNLKAQLLAKTESDLESL